MGWWCLFVCYGWMVLRLVATGWLCDIMGNYMGGWFCGWLVMRLVSW